MSKKYNIDKRITLKGYWYLPSDPENKIAGILTYDPNNSIVLELFGGFNCSLDALVSNKQKEVDVIFGKTSDGEDITLLHSSRSANIKFGATFPLVSYSSSYLIIGKHINGLDERCNYWACVKIPELSHWCPPSAVTISLSSQETTRINITFDTQYQNVMNVIDKVQIDDNTSVTLAHDVNFNSSEMLLTPKIEQYTYLKITKEKQASIKEILWDIITYEQFLSLATLSIVKSSSIIVFDDELYWTCDNKKYYRPISIIHLAGDLNTKAQTAIRTTGFLFDYQTIKDHYADLLRKWYSEPENIAPIRSHLIDSLERKKVYSSVDFLVIIQAIEGFWWRFRDLEYRNSNNIPKKQKTTLNTILSELLSEFDDVEQINTLELNIEAVIDSRHYYSHFVPKTRKPKTLFGWQLINQAKRLRLLLLCCVLSFLGLQHSLINSILEECHATILKHIDS